MSTVGIERPLLTRKPVGPTQTREAESGQPFNRALVGFPILSIFEEGYRIQGLPGFGNKVSTISRVLRSLSAVFLD